MNDEDSHLLTSPAAFSLQVLFSRLKRYFKDFSKHDCAHHVWWCVSADTFALYLSIINTFEKPPDFRGFSQFRCFHDQIFFVVCRFLSNFQGHVNAATVFRVGVWLNVVSLDPCFHLDCVYLALEGSWFDCMDPVLGRGQLFDRLLLVFSYTIPTFSMFLLHFSVVLVDKPFSSWAVLII